MAGERLFNGEQRQLFDGLSYNVQTATRLALGITPEDFRDNYNPWSPLYGSLSHLSVFDRDHARAIFDAMVSSPNRDIRDYLTSEIDFIIGHDFEYGYALWDQLMGDPSRTVRRSAHDTLKRHLRYCESPDGKLVCENLSQLTYRDASDLLLTLSNAEMNRAYYRLGPVALAGTGVEVVPPAESSPQAPNTDPTAT